MKKANLLLIAVFTFFIGYSQNTVTTLEYFIDTDNGVGLNTIVDITDGEDITEAILATIPVSTNVGYHKLYIRTKDNENRWSLTTRKNIEIIAPIIQNNVLLGEYFLDSDMSYTSGVSFEINSQEIDITQAFMAQIPETASIGYHKLYGRVKDGYGNWSHTFRKNIQVVENSNNNIVAIEYFFGDDLEFGNATSITIDTPETDGTWLFRVPYPTGNYNFSDTLFVRAKNTNNKWSHTTILDEVDTSLSVTSFVNNNLIKVYPNPIKEVLNISSLKAFNIKTISIFDITGKKVFASTENIRTLNLNSLQNGIYILTLTTDIGNASYKLIKQ